MRPPLILCPEQLQTMTPERWLRNLAFLDAAESSPEDVVRLCAGPLAELAAEVAAMSVVLASHEADKPAPVPTKAEPGPTVPPPVPFPVGSRVRCHNDDKAGIGEVVAVVSKSYRKVRWAGLFMFTCNCPLEWLYPEDSPRTAAHPFSNDPVTE